jgi:hypothetical protein
MTPRLSPYWAQMSDAERRIVQFALDCSDGSTTYAAARLGVTYHFLRRRAAMLGIIVRVGTEAADEASDPAMQDEILAAPPAARAGRDAKPRQRRRGRPPKAESAPPGETKKRRSRTPRRAAATVTKVKPDAADFDDDDAVFTAEEVRENTAGADDPTRPNRPALRVIRNAPEE